MARQGFLSLMSTDFLDFTRGDVMGACTCRRARHIRAEEICNSDRQLKQFWCDHTFQFRLERISPTEARKIDLFTGEEKRVDQTTMDIPRAIKYLRHYAPHMIYGEPGSEILYGGQIRVPHEQLDVIWAEIERKTDRRESEITDPFGTYRNRHTITVHDFTDEKAAEFVQPLMDGERMVKPRAYYVKFWGNARSARRVLRKSI